MSENPNPTNGNGWFTPADIDWREIASPSPQPARRTRVPTLPTTVSVTPRQSGGWHLPQIIDTTARPPATAPRPEDVVPAPPPAEAAAPRPEDTAAVPRPEDEALGLEDEDTTPRPEDITLADTAVAETTRAPRPEDEALGFESVTAAAEAPPPEDSLADFGDDYEDALAELEEDDTAFGFSELMALESLASDAPEGDVEQGAAREVEITPADEEDTEELDNLSLAERAAMGISTPAEEEASGFDYAAQIAALEQGEAAGDTLSYSAGQPPVEGSADGPAAVDGGTFSYEEQIRRLQGEGLEQTQALDETPAATPIDLERAELIEQFQRTEQQIYELRQQRDAGLISEQQLDSQLRELVVLDNDNNWWMMGKDTEIWYRYDPGAQEWIVAEPPHRAAARQSAIPTDTGTLDPNEVIRGSLPQVGADEGSYTAAQDPFNSEGFTPVTDYVPPRETTPQDPGATLVGDAAFRETLPGSEPTVATPAVQFDEEDTYTPPDEGIVSPMDEGEAAAPGYEDYEEYGDVVGRARERQQRSTLSTLLIAAGVLFAIVLIGGAAIIGGMTLWYNSIADRWSEQVTNIDLISGGQTPFQSVYIYDAAGNEIARLRSPEGGDRVYVPIGDISPYMLHATVSVENERFFQDPGFDLIAISRAFLQNLTNQEVVTGASTITQQLARSIVLQDETFQDEGDRKLNEIIVASELSRTYTKEQILEAYLNNVYFGNLQYGVQAAAEFYFDKDARDINLAEAALLAGLIQAPAQFDPVSNPQAAFNRLDAVAARMAQVGCLNVPNNGGQPLCITPETLRGEAAVQISEVKIRPYLPEENEFEYPHFTIFVQERLQQQFTQDEIFRRGFRIYTTLNPTIQQTAETALETQIDVLAINRVRVGTIMVTDPRTGAIRAMVGSPDFNNEDINGQINYALTYQQPGSAVKPITYSAALSGIVTGQGAQGYYTPATILWDVPTNYPDGTAIQNFDGRYLGPVTVRNALQQSLNVPAVKAYAFVGQQNFIQQSQAMGIRFQDEASFTLATGLGATEVRPYDMMEAYGSIAAGGTLNPLFAIERIEDFNGNPVEYNRPEPSQAMSGAVAYLMQDILSDDQARIPQFGANNRLGAGFPADSVGVKTGTSNNASDLWTVGFTQSAVVGVWLGTVEQNQPTTGDLTGYLAASPAWRRVMDAVVAASPPQPFPVPNGVVEARYCSLTGTQIASNVPCPGEIRIERFVDGQLPPPATEGFVREVTIDTWTRQLYDQNLCPDDPAVIQAANIDDLAAVSWLNNNPNGQAFARSIGLPVPLVQAPEQTCGTGTTILQASITSPQPNATIMQSPLQVQGFINNVPNFEGYSLQVASANAPNNFQIISTSNQLPGAQQLGTWDVSGFQNGGYILRLAVTNTEGGFAYRDVPITLQLPDPTATPTPQPSPTPPAIPTSPPIVVPTSPGGIDPTPIPFDEPTVLPFDTGQDFSP